LYSFLCFDALFHLFISQSVRMSTLPTVSPIFYLPISLSSLSSLCLSPQMP
jgi:hypothetical protein